jgi:aryl-alcohol dehydrogenase-like predicted oxidoreductase
LSLDRYRLLGRSGLRVAPLALGMGTLIFGTHWEGGHDPQRARRIFDAYLDYGGNFIDTAPNYESGASEQMVGTFAQGKRPGLVIATKYSFAVAHNGHIGGNHRKSMVQSVEQSLKRLQTDYIDLLYLHAWDACTPVEEILRSFDDLVSAGKVLYFGMSNVPAWQVARMQAIADLRGWAHVIALQLQYNLAERTSERELLPMAHELGIGAVPWSPLAGGVLTGKYCAADIRSPDSNAGSYKSFRHIHVSKTGALTERNLTIAESIRSVALRIGATAAQVALAWLRREPTVASIAIGVRNLGQFEENLGCLALEIDAEAVATLEEASKIDYGFPHTMLHSLAAEDLLETSGPVRQRLIPKRM